MGLGDRFRVGLGDRFLWVGLSLLCLQEFVFYSKEGEREIFWLKFILFYFIFFPVWAFC